MRPLATPRRAALLLSLATLLLLVPALAQAFNWLVPAGGETWTAGTTHTVEWAGTPGGNVNIQVIDFNTASVVGNVTLGAPNAFVASWSLPPSLPPGPYQLYIEDVPTSTWSYSAVFTVRAVPPCAVGCTYVTVVPTYYGAYPGTQCSTNANVANGLAQVWVADQLANLCTGVIDPTSVMADYTYLPSAVCEVGQFGPYAVEASAIACCCAGATPAERRTWGRLKTIYR
jgi:hypothetical protein